MAKTSPGQRSSAVLAATGMILVASLSLTSASDGHREGQRVGCIGAAGPARDVPAITADPSSTLWSQQYAAAERVMLGLDSSDKTIAAAADNPLSSTEQLGTPVTPDESAQLLRQDVANRAVLNGDCSVVQSLRSVAPAGIMLQAVPAKRAVGAAVLQREFARLDSSFPSLERQGVVVDLAEIDERANAALRS
ncbi:MAG: hypothetical protein ACR2KL_02730 [Nocardioidaceae bacterium]